MLVLTRKLQEKIQIGQDITITVLRVTGRSVRIGIEAPKGVRVLRAEIPMNEFDVEPSHEVPTEVRPPHVAEAATAVSDDEEHLETAEVAQSPMDAPLSFHIARRVRIITPNDNLQSNAHSAAQIVNRIAAIAAS